MNRLIAGITMMMVLSGMAACKIGKKPVRKQVMQDTAVVQNPPLADTTVKRGDSIAAANPAKQLLIDSLQSVWKQEINFSTFSGKAKMHFEIKDEKQDVVANFRIKKDSAIWVAVNATVLSVQVARVYVTPDSFKLINYLQKYSMVMAISDAKKFLPADVDFSTLQNLIIGNALKSLSQPTDATDFGGTWSVQMEGADYVQQLTYNKSDSTMRSSQLRTKAANGPQAMIQYGNYEKKDERKFANSRAINTINGQEQYYIDMNFSNAVFDQPVDMPFTIPAKYTVK
ncbi:DUF4292 domain-containing protein [Taibaiella soli]|uniref:DUF4292 domain-containing protein n=1 Tax=Taibaiella soli TaxID=1649169 RepID=A0A2W2AD91_9BACT|nr:DUF4292 domain-containing protein [Taibaiella soli]PZF73415.1 hypothetical protein DN068_08470 [Taibaiella soli]